MKPRKSCSCGMLAVWCYIPSCSWPEEDRFACDACVPRGCSCNQEFDDDGNDLGEVLDEFGRKYPCCEWFYDAQGWDE